MTLCERRSHTHLTADVSRQNSMKLKFDAATALLSLSLACVAAFAGAKPIPRVAIELSDADSESIRKQIVYPRQGLKWRRVAAFRNGDKQAWFDTAFVETNYYEETTEYRKHFRTHCRKLADSWKCDKPQDILELPGPHPVIVGEGITSRDVLEVAKFLREYPLRDWKQKHRLLAAVTLVQLRFWRSDDGDYGAQVRSDVDRYCGAWLRLTRHASGTLSVTNEPAIYCA